MGKIGEIWAKLSLKKDDFDKGLDQANTKAKGFGSSLKSMGVAAKAAWAAVGAAAVKAINEFINSSQTLGDEWAMTVSGMKSRWQNFISTINRGIADKSDSRKFLWNPFYFFKKAFGSGEGDSANLAGQAKAQALDALTEIENAFRIESSQMGPRLNELYLKMMNTALSGTERAAAGAEYRKLLEPIYAKRTQGYQDVMNASIQNWAAIGGISGKYTNEEIVSLVTMMGKNASYVEQNYSDFYKAYQSIGDNLTSEMVDAIVAYNSAANDLNESLRRIDRVTMNAGNMDVSPAGGDSGEQAMSYGDVIDKTISDVISRIEDGKYEVESTWNDIFDMADVEWETPELDISKTEESLQQLMDDWNDTQQSLQEFNDGLSSILEEGIEDGIITLSEGLGKLAAAGNVDEFAVDMINQMASFAKKFGTFLIESGVGALALKDMIKNPYAAIAAGVALVALSGFASQKAQAMTDSFTGSSSSGSSSSTATNDQNISTELTIHVVGRLDGKDILLSSERAKQYYSR